MGEWFRQRIELSGFRIMRDGQSVTQTWRCPVKLCLVVRVPRFGLERAHYWCDKFALANAGTPNTELIARLILNAGEVHVQR
jgi:hypothetical protein